MVGKNVQIIEVFLLQKVEKLRFTPSQGHDPCHPLAGPWGTRLDETLNLLVPGSQKHSSFSSGLCAD